MEQAKHIVSAKVIAHAFDSKNAIQYFPGDIVEIDLGNSYQRRLAWLRTPRGKWIFEFDRASASNPSLRIFFCKECGQPFDKFTDIGTHTRQAHNNDSVTLAKAKAANDAEAEAKAQADYEATTAGTTQQA